ncbi:class I SAM-dependent methyltransferase [Oceanicoccus sagamiensis]|uniref:SAM-dependent methyltransferase n=1 Tax=Oceanicoccus sagamiensis TaxID=716816 RepID=A0A1X9NB37_9GAMM|nr:class I SAM-dependent methyltransferase [Oceanicoccus sagamiensis]ARN74264.1 SAM-dependent methyltransferase [Oceanicoccus sagamiensis]
MLRTTTLLITLLLLPSAFAEQHTTRYQTVDPSRDGIGKVYMDREIAHVMGHLGAGWLERPKRVAEERTDLLISNMDLKPDDVVVDLGAGTGFFSFPIARRLTQGQVIAVDIQPEMLAIIESRKQQLGIDNVTTVQASEKNPNLKPASVDSVLMVDAYHEFSYPYEVMSAIVKALKPGGRVILVEYRGEDPRVPIKLLHKMTEQQARKEMAAVGLSFVKTDSYLPQQHVLIFSKQ